MLMAVDAGNTTIEFGIFDGDNLIGRFRCITKQTRTSDEFAVLLKNFLSFKDLDYKNISEVIISSVVPDVNYTLTSTFIKYFSINPVMIGPGIKTGIRLMTDNAREVGADRIVDALAAYTIYGGPVIVLNFGTASRYDLVNEKGDFCAAVTCPGIQISADALWYQAAKLPKIEIAKPDSILATNTITSMQAGLVYGVIGQTEYIVKKIKEESGLPGAKTVACGGYAKLVADNTDIIDYYDPLLTMKGLKFLHERNRR